MSSAGLLGPAELEKYRCMETFRWSVYRWRNFTLCQQANIERRNVIFFILEMVDPNFVPVFLSSMYLDLDASLVQEKVASDFIM